MERLPVLPPERALPAGREKGRKSLRVLVSGGAGFIGSHLCDHWLAAGCEVHGRGQSLHGTPGQHCPFERQFAVPVSRARRVRAVRAARKIRLASCTWRRRPARWTTCGRRSRPWRSTRPERRTCSISPGATGGVFACLDVGMLRRPVGASPTRGILGQREPRRPRGRCTTKRSVFRRGADDGLSPRVRRQYAFGQALQYLRAAHEARRRARRAGPSSPRRCKGGRLRFSATARRRAVSATYPTWCKGLPG